MNDMIRAGVEHIRTHYSNAPARTYNAGGWLMRNWIPA